MTGTNSFRKIDVVDRLRELKMDLDARKGEGTSGNRLGAQAIIPLEDAIDVDDIMEVNPDLITLADPIDVDDVLTFSGHNSGQYQITNDAGGGAGVTQPGKIGFSDIG